MKNKSGFTLIELLIALAIMNTLIVGSLMLVDTSSKLSERTNVSSYRSIENDELIKLLGEDKYFGALAAYTDNVPLKKCIEVDSHVCQTNFDYQIVPMDLASGLPIESLVGHGNQSIKNIVTFQVHCKDNAAECDQAEYFTVKLVTEVTKAEQVISRTEKTSVVRPFLPKVVSFIPDSTLSPGRAINAILFIDTSGSMLFAKDKIKDALDSLLAKLSGMDVNLAILPLSATTVSERFFRWAGDGSKAYLEIKDANPGEILYREEKYSVNYGTQYQVGDSLINPTFRKIHFSQSDPFSDKNTKVTAAKALIDHLFNINVESHKDSSLCSLMHFVAGESTPFTVDPMTPTFVMTITNEDDESTMVLTSAPIPTSGADAYNSSYKYCVKELNRTIRKGLTNSSYFGKALTYKVTFSAQLLIDGAPVFKTVTTDIRTPYFGGATPGASCTGTPSLTNEVLAYLNTSDAYKDKYLGSLNILDCKYNANTFFKMSESANDNLCNQLEVPHRNSFSFYIHDSCWENRVNEPGSLAVSISDVGIHSIVPFSPTSVAVTEVLYDGISSSMGATNFFYVPVIHENSCPVTPGAQIGGIYQKLAGLLSPAAATHQLYTPVCASSFNSKIYELEGLMSKLAVNDFNLPLDVSANFSGLVVLRGSETLNPTNGVDYKIEHGTVIFKTGYIEPTDIVRIFYK